MLSTASAVLAAGLAAAAGNDTLTGGYSAPIRGPGQQRAEARLRAKMQANAKFYAGATVAPDSRQVRRALARNPYWAARLAKRAKGA